MVIVSGVVLNASHGLPYLILTATLWDQSYYHPHFTDNEAKAGGEVGCLAQDHKRVGRGAGVRTPTVWPQGPRRSQRAIPALNTAHFRVSAAPPAPGVGECAGHLYRLPAHLPQPERPASLSGSCSQPAPLPSKRDFRSAATSVRVVPTEVLLCTVRVGAGCWLWKTSTPPLGHLGTLALGGTQ